MDERACRPGEPKRDFAVVIGRVAPEKGFHNAVEALRRARVLAPGGDLLLFN